MSENKKIVVALDLFDPIKARAIAQKIGEEVFAFKVGWPLILGSSSDIINDITRYGKVICDIGLANIPDMNKAITENVKDHGAWGIVTHSIIGKDSLEAVVKNAGDMKVFSIVSMSHPGSSLFIDKELDALCTLSANAGVYGVVAPGNRPEIMARVKNNSRKMKIMAAGIGTQGGDPLVASQNGADYLVIGRAICNSRDPLRELDRINAILERWEETRGSKQV